MNLLTPWRKSCSWTSNVGQELPMQRSATIANARIRSARPSAKVGQELLRHAFMVHDMSDSAQYCGRK